MYVCMYVCMYSIKLLTLFFFYILCKAINKSFVSERIYGVESAFMAFQNLLLQLNILKKSLNIIIGSVSGILSLNRYFSTQDN